MEMSPLYVNSLRPKQNGRHFPDDMVKCIFLNENVWLAIKISLKFVPKGSINNISALVKIMAWRRPGGKPLSEAMLVILLMHICVTRPQWVNADVSTITHMSSTVNAKSVMVGTLHILFTLELTPIIMYCHVLLKCQCIALFIYKQSDTARLVMRL